MNFTNSPFERMMRQRPGTDSDHPLHFLPTPQGVRLHDAPVQKEIPLGLWRYGSSGIRHGRCLMPLG